MSEFEIEGKWMSLRDILDFIDDRFMFNDSKFVIDNFDFKYVDIRVDMRTGHAILNRGTKKMDVIKENQELKQQLTDCEQLVEQLNKIIGQRMV